MTKLPHNFQVTDDHRRYCTNMNLPLYLADVLRDKFVQNWQDRIEDGRPPKWKHADLAFKRWIRESKPGGTYYKPDDWERALQKAKSLEYGKRTKPPAEYHPQQVEKPPQTIRVSDEVKKLADRLRSE